MSGECGEHFSSRRSWLSQHIFPCCVTSPQRESSSRCTLAFYIFSAVQPLSNVTVETLFPLSQSVGLSFLPSQPSFPFSFFSLGRFSSHPAPARWQSSLSPAWIIHCLFQKPRVQRCFFFLLRSCVCFPKLNIGNFQHSHPRIFKHQRCRLLQMHALFVCWPTRVAAPRVLCIVAGA